MRVAFLGTRGVPARYGGFESAVEEIGAGLSALGHDVVVYCRGGAGRERATYRGMTRIVRPAVRRKTLETLTHTGLSAVHAVRRRPDVALVFNAANAPWVGLLRAAGVPTALHVDGHDGRRAKWGAAGRRYYSVATRAGAAAATEVVVDSRAVGRELEAEHGIRSTYIPYGADAAEPPTSADVHRALTGLGLFRGGYHLVVSRFEPENHVAEIVEGYARSAATLPLVVVGFAGFPGAYARRVDAAVRSDPRVRCLGPIWDQSVLSALYSGAATYLHGHSVGGTNPALLAAMISGTPVLAYDCPYNRETTGGSALWFSLSAGVATLVQQCEVDGAALTAMAVRAAHRAEAHYTWEQVVDEYDQLVRRLAGGPLRRTA